MKRVLFAVLAVFLFTQVGRAQTSNPAVVYPAQNDIDTQTRFLAGVSGGSEYGNMFLSTTAGLEAPIGNHFEVDLGDSFAPLEEHVALGHGWANDASAGAIVWATKRVGFNGSTEYSNYSVSISKGSYYASGGVVLRAYAWGTPSRFFFDYVRQYGNGIACGTAAACALPGADGTETDHLQGVSFTAITRLGAVGPAIVRVVFNMQAGRVLTQGNPVCDGTFGITGGPNGGPCYRTGTVAGGASFGVTFEFPRHRGEENSLF